MPCDHILRILHTSNKNILNAVTIASDVDSMQKTATMLYLIAGLFAIAAVIGVILIKNFLIPNRPPRAAVYIHGLLAAIALVLMIMYIVQNQGSERFYISLALFVVAALGGFALFFRDLRNKLGPAWLAIVHALVAVSGFLILLFNII
ncbi:MAG TPA: hypothetical protein VNR87_00425 [Flavisolibacter sp.]|nr:hypothetical protein [Flavisolibacter sp.]